MSESQISWDGCSRFARLVNPGKADGGCQRSPSGNAHESELGGNDESKKFGNGSFSKPRSDPGAYSDDARAVTSPQNSLSDYGAVRSVPHGRPKCRNCVGSKRGAGSYIRRGQDSDPRTPWLRNCHRRQEWFCMCCRERVDVAFRRSGILESQTSWSNLFQSAGRAIRVADYS